MNRVDPNHLSEIQIPGRFMTFEVEVKYPLADREQILAALDDLGAEREEAVRQVDLYFSHPVRDFAETDEALRIRATGDETRVTYKGPLVDSKTKTRREIEIPFGRTADDRNRLAELLEVLGFRKVRTVEKSRLTHRLMWEGRDVEIVIDDVSGLGLFVEVEAFAEETDRRSVGDSILRLGSRLGLENPQRKSYLCLLLEKEGN